MKIIFSIHSLLKLEHRDIPRKRVIQTVKNPDYVLSSLSGRKIACKKFIKLYLKVVFIEENGNIIVITQYWDGKFKL